MEKSLRRRDVEGANCDWSVYTKSEEEIFEKAAEHARKEHNMTQNPKN